MYKQHCILTLNQDTHVLAARHMQIDGLNGTNSYTGPQQDARQTRCRSRCTLAPACSSNAPPCQLSDDIRKSRACPRIETHDGGEQTRWRIRHTLAGTWHRKQQRGQRPMEYLMLRSCSGSRYDGAPARRKSARRRLDHLPSPRCRRMQLDVPATRYSTSCRAVAVRAARHAASDNQCCCFATAPAAAVGRAGPLRRSHARPEP